MRAFTAISGLMGQFEHITTFRALVALAAVIFIIFLLNINARRKRREIQTREHMPSANADLKVEGLRRELESLLVELAEFSRQANAQMETRFAKLDKAIRDADQRIAALQRLQNGAAAENGKDDEVSAANRDAMLRLNGDRTSTTVNSRTVTAASKTEFVYQLTDAGVAPADIARRLNCSIGEVELLLNLRDRED